MALDGNGRLFVVHKDGRLKIVSVLDGSVLAERQVPPPVWDGLAIASRRVYLTCQSGELVCVGEEQDSQNPPLNARNTRDVHRVLLGIE
jgi:hypothetical protein